MQESESRMSLGGARDDDYARLYRRREEQRRRRRRKRALSLLGALALLLMGGYVAAMALNEDATTTGTRRAESTQPTLVRSSTRETSVTSETAPTVTATPSRRAKRVSAAFLTDADETSFRNLERDLGRKSGLAVSAIGLEQ